MSKRMELVDFAIPCKSQTHQPFQVLKTSILAYSAKIGESIINFCLLYLVSKTRRQTRMTIEAKAKVRNILPALPVSLQPAV
jgi:hypothetical protein